MTMPFFNPFANTDSLCIHCATPLLLLLLFIQHSPTFYLPGGWVGVQFAK
jgi:hypothetical protein